MSPATDPTPREPDPRDEPTDTEVYVLRAYIKGGSCKAAAARLGLAESTVKNHLLNLRSKLGARTNAEAAFLLHDRLAA